MNEAVRSFLEEFREVVGECRRFCFMSRGKELQEFAVKRLTEFKGRAVALKRQAMELEDEDSANGMLSLESLVDAKINELGMWIALKEDEPNKAWDFLVSAQGNVRTALQAHDMSLGMNATGYADKLHQLERLLFPPQIFCSPSMIVSSVECSVCGEEYGVCEHVVGKAYMGEICCMSPRYMEIEGFSMVEVPASKHARMTQFSENGVTRDFMTWRPVEEEQPDIP